MGSFGIGFPLSGASPTMEVFYNAADRFSQDVCKHRVLNGFGGGGPRYAANPGLTPSFRRSLPETGCLSQGLPYGKRFARARSPHAIGACFAYDGTE